MYHIYRYFTQRRLPTALYFIGEMFFILHRPDIPPLVFLSVFCLVPKCFISFLKIIFRISVVSKMYLFSRSRHNLNWIFIFRYVCFKVKMFVVWSTTVEPVLFVLVCSTTRFCHLVTQYFRSALWGSLSISGLTFSLDKQLKAWENETGNQSVKIRLCLIPSEK